MVGLLEPPEMDCPHGVGPGTRLGPYRIVQQIGTGGMSDIFEARHQQLPCVYAVKVGRDTDPGLHRRFVQEARMQSSLHHPNIVRVVDLVAGPHGHPAIVMDHVAGGTLEQWLHRDRDPSPERWLPLYRDTVAAVAFAHEHAIVHRDVKAENVLLDTTGARPRGRLADFGIAKALRSNVTATSPLTIEGTAMGSPGYVAPEQLLDAASVDGRADLYSLGCLLFTMITGHRPFDAGTRTEMLVQMQDGPPDVGGLDPRLDELLTDLMCADPDQRTSSCAELQERLNAIALSDFPDRATTPADPPAPASLPTRLYASADAPPPSEVPTRLIDF